ncbi:hypothetical protein [Lolliginicoccus levis]|uniref:hypothetical protein n=1 Tax=Lolliginicoccus levis TaxID=2919542 RepID=UPI00241C1541|nr:hypothetical protein [Lolliginicoccus levis]
MGERHYSARKRLREAQQQEKRMRELGFSDTLPDMDIPPAQLDRPLAGVYPLPSGTRYRGRVLVIAALFLVPILVAMILTVLT